MWKKKKSIDFFFGILALGLLLPLSVSAELVGHWPFDGNLNDVVGSNHGTIIIMEETNQERLDDTMELVGNTTIDNVLIASTMALTGTVHIMSGVNPVVAAVDVVLTGYVASMSGLLFKKKYKWVPNAVIVGIIAIGIISNRKKK